MSLFRFPAQQLSINALLSDYFAPGSLLAKISRSCLLSLILCWGMCWSYSCFALSGQAYMDRFNTFSAWYQQIPIRPSAEFLAFVKESTPLANKLRDKWLYELARIKDWPNYVAYYQPTSDTNLVCYAEIAKYNLGQQDEVRTSFIPIWLSGNSQPQACNTLFDLLIKNDQLDQNLITQRIALALDQQNIHLARYLIKLYKTPHPEELELLTKIYQQPTSIRQLKPGELSAELYLYGLKRMFTLNMDKALTFWKEDASVKFLPTPQKQAFLAHVALYKAMRNNPDALFWFKQVKPEYYTDLLVDWQIRLALKTYDWPHVEELILASKNKESPCWQYWLARALEMQDKKVEANLLYQPLAKSRQYYGFLASLRLHKKPSFENEKTTTDLTTLKPYQPVIDQIKVLYMTKKNQEASRLLNDFMSELPKDDASALVFWVDSELQWHGKSVYLSNNDHLNNQLALRFPLAYKNTVKYYAKQYAIAPEFVYAIIRQESGFREDVISSAGARGLMQLMPRTASLVSKASRIDYKDQNQLFTSQKNINIGIAYLQQLAKRFSNHPVLVAAAYNAGPRQVVYWLKTHPPKEIDIWIETLPWQETRNYLKNVMAFSLVYQYRLQQKPNMDDFLLPL